MVQINFLIWDVPPYILQRPFKPPHGLQNAHGLLLVFDLSRLNTLKNLLALVKETIKRMENSPIMILVGNKNDLSTERQIGDVDIAEFRHQFWQAFGKDIWYFESSAKTGNNVHWIFETLARKILPNNATTVSLIGPHGVQSRYPLIQWSASDPAGDPLTYRLSYSLDGGETWILIKTGDDHDFIGLRYVWDPIGLIPGDTYLIRVEASDGELTAAAESDQLSTIPPPEETEGGALIPSFQTGDACLPCSVSWGWGTGTEPRES